MAGLEELYSKQVTNNDGSYFKLVDDSPRISNNGNIDLRNEASYAEQFKKKRDSSEGMYATNSQQNFQRKPVSGVSSSGDFRLPPIENKNVAYGNGEVDGDYERPESNGSDVSLKLTKNIVKWNFWWDKVDSNIRVRAGTIPNYKKKALPKVHSLDNYTYRPGGGNIKVIDQKPVWKKEPRTDHKMHDYHKNGGNIQIMNVKSHNWKANSKINSLDNVRYQPGGGNIQILDQPNPTHRKGAKPRIDTGFVYQEMLVSQDYSVKPVVRRAEQLVPPRSQRSPFSDVRTHKFREN